MTDATKAVDGHGLACAQHRGRDVAAHGQSCVDSQRGAKCSANREIFPAYQRIYGP